ncbi:MerR family transcriptional regulator [Nonomuraea lactucae]|uniref:MerR family transcriptional regulator n=1 Tax=Nonomuraea lactucae TaxID=2249762 RepID=UPI000DE1ED08|nr:GyrI-like domain-containing protein [Nonomuraea lactucae]
MDEDLLPIGQFARLGRLSVKQLRHYDELGLLAPAYVDAGTGYRYYRASQARVALSIGLLRSLDVPLTVIAEVLAGAAGALDSVRDGLEAELARRRRTLASLERVMTEGLPSSRVRVVTEPARRVGVVRERAASWADVSRATSAGVARLMALLPAGDRPDGPGRAAEVAVPGQGAVVQLIGLFPVDLDDPVEVAVALVLGPGAVRSLPGGVAVEVLPGGAFACATHVGPYDQIPLTAHAVLAWCAERRHEVRGPIREAYVSNPAVTPPDQLVTHLMIPLEER